jgi:Ca2+-transporting ATPase
MELDSAYLESELIFLGIVGIEDPVREGVLESVKTCHTAGINVKMITGDNVETAISVARRCGIL